MTSTLFDVIMTLISTRAAVTAFVLALVLAPEAHIYSINEIILIVNLIIIIFLKIAYYTK